MKYKQNDYELLYLVEEENEDAKELLYEKYQSILKGLAKSMYDSCKQWNGVEYQDFYQEACYGFEKAIATFDESKNILFYTYATSCIRNQLSFYRRSLTRKKDTPLNCSISLYQEVEKGLEYADLLKSTQQTPMKFVKEWKKKMKSESCKIIFPFKTHVSLNCAIMVSITKKFPNF